MLTHLMVLVGFWVLGAMFVAVSPPQVVGERGQTHRAACYGCDRNWNYTWNCAGELVVPSSSYEKSGVVWLAKIHPTACFSGSTETPYRRRVLGVVVGEVKGNMCLYYADDPNVWYEATTIWPR